MMSGIAPELVAELQRAQASNDPAYQEDVAQRLQKAIEDNMNQLTNQDREKFMSLTQVAAKAAAAGPAAAGVPRASKLFPTFTSQSVTSPAMFAAPMMPGAEVVEEAKPLSSEERIVLAAKAGDLDDLKELLKSHPDLSVQRHLFCFPGEEEGHPLIMWAAMDGQSHVCRYLVHEHRVSPDVRNGKGETALHWATFKGKTKCVHALLSELGADLYAADGKGYTALHYAAKAGHGFLCAMLHRRGLPVDVKDNHGRTPLHWAAYRDQLVCLKWLLAHGADPTVLDWEKCTPLHWATLRGNPQCAHVLVELGASGPLLFQPDQTGETPPELAIGKIERCKKDVEKGVEGAREMLMGVTYVSGYFSHRLRLEKELRDHGITRLMRVAAKMPHWTWFLYPVLAPMGWYQYYTFVLPGTSHHLWLHGVFILSFWAALYAWTRLQFAEPGDYVVPRGVAGTRLGMGALGMSESAKVPNTWGWRRGGFPQFGAPDFEGRTDAGRDTKDERATKVNPRYPDAARHRALYDRVLDEALDVPVCLTCEIVKPIRGKHDKITDVCVAKFDHFCPFFNACVGESNYAYFFFTALFNTISMWVWTILVVLVTMEAGAPGDSFLDTMRAWWKFELFAFLYGLIGVWGLGMTVQHLYLVSKNLSTNEMISGGRYRYLVEDGARGNPFNRGVLMNVLEIFGLIPFMRMDLEQYYAQELAGEPARIVGPVPSSSPWFGKQGGGGHGHSHGGFGGHGHSHGGGGDHGHSHAGGGDHGHSHAGGGHGHSH